jgi:hypothetical protein
VHKHAHPDAPRGVRRGPGAGRDDAVDGARGKRRRPRRHLWLLVQAPRASPVRRCAPAHRALRLADRIRRHSVWVGRRGRRGRGRRTGGRQWSRQARVVSGRARQPYGAEGGSPEVHGASFPWRAIRTQVSVLA